MLHVGLDLSRTRLDVHVMTEVGAPVLVTTAAPDAGGLASLAARIGEFGQPVTAAIESMTGARFVHDQLELRGWDVEVADSVKVRGLAPLAAKTDRIDAWVLAELSRRELVPAIWLPDPAVRGEGERARWRLHLVRHRTALKNRIHATLMAFGHPCPVSDLVLRSSKQVGAAPSAVSWRWRWPSPDPGFGVAVELGGGQLGGVGDLGRVGEGLPGEGVPAEDAPPRLLRVQPAGALGDEHLLDARMPGQPGPGGQAGMAGEVVGDHRDRSGRVGLLQSGEKFLPVHAVARRRAAGDRLPVADPQAAVDPGLLRSAAVGQRRLGSVAVGAPARRRGEGARRHRAELVGGNHRGVRRRVDVELDDPGSFGPNSGSALAAQERGRRQRTPSASRIRRTWERARSMPAARAAAVSAFRVHTAGPAASAGRSSPASARTPRPGGGLATRATSWERRSWLIRGLRPAPGPAPSPSSPSAAKRASR